MEGLKTIKARETTETVKALQNYTVGKYICSLYQRQGKAVEITGDPEIFYTSFGFIIETNYPEAYEMACKLAFK